MKDHRHKYLTIIICISILSFIATLCLKGLASAGVFLGGIVIIIFITKVIWRHVPNIYTVRNFSLFISSTVVFSYGFWQSFLDAAVKTYLPDIPDFDNATP